MNSRHLFNCLCYCSLFILFQNRIYMNVLNQTTLMLRKSHFHVGLVRSQNQVPSQYMNVIFNHDQHCNGPFAFVNVQIPVQLEKKVVDNVFQFVPIAIINNSLKSLMINKSVNVFRGYAIENKLFRFLVSKFSDCDN